METLQLKPKISYFGEVKEGTLVNFTYNGECCEVLIPKKDLQYGEMQNFLDSLTEEELIESVCPEYLREHSYVDDINLIFGGNLS